MKVSLEHLKEIKSLEESPIVRQSTGSVIGWNVSALGATKVLAGGTHSSKVIARRIAISETIERKCFKVLSESNLHSAFLIDQFPTSCGFSAGFESDKTRFRAISEAIERWAWSKWIDEQFLIPTVKVKMSEVTPLAENFLSYFDEVNFFKVEIECSTINSFFEKVKFGIVIGQKDGGVFPGSRVSLNDEDIWQHASLEAWRHLKIFNNFKNKKMYMQPYDRIVYFGFNGFEALSRIDSAQRKKWPMPTIRLLKEYQSQIPTAKVWRCLANDFIGWHLGGESRFVY